MSFQLSNTGGYNHFSRHCMKIYVNFVAVVILVAAIGWGNRGYSAEASSGSALNDGVCPPVRIFPHLTNPKVHPDYERRHVQPPDWETFGNRTRFTTLRGFGVQDGKIVNFEDELEKYTQTYELGDVIWPSYPILFADNLDELATEIKRRELFLFDIWGYVPGSGPGGYWQQFQPDPAVFQVLEEQLGPRWLGMDVGEQDGRYVGGYASQMTPQAADRFEQYLNLQRHFQLMCDELGNKMSTLLSLNFGHHFLKEGVYTLIGAETAQGLPNAQVYYSFIRGAGKQYGVLWFGNASIFNRWGWKTYGSEGKNGGYQHGPTKGTSLSLLKRLLYMQMFSNCVTIGFENGWFDAQGEFSPIGVIQREAKKWVAKNGQPGVMLTPVAVMTDFYSGWSFPRHLYTGNVYRVWGNLPYGAGDYLTDGVLDMIYPGYQDASYFKDERGFLTPTPYGDAVDCLLTDAPGWLLDRYALLIVTGELEGGAELRDKLQNYIEQGGTLFLTAGNLCKLPGGLADVHVGDESLLCPDGTGIELNNSSTFSESAFEYRELSFPSDAHILARRGNDSPAAIEVSVGKGRLIVTASCFGVGAKPETQEKIKSEVEKALPKPYPLLQHVQALIDDLLQEQVLFEAGEDLGWVTCRKGPGEYWLCIANNAYEQKALNITSHCGRIASIEEFPLDRSEVDAVGYLPETLEGTELGTNDSSHIAGGDVRIFRVCVEQERTESIAYNTPPPGPKGRVLNLRKINSIKEAILRRPTFFEHFDSVVVDWSYLHNRERSVLEQESGWINRQGLNIFVDVSSGINLYPDLRLVNNMEESYKASIDTIRVLIDKMDVLGAHDLILTLHRQPENNITWEDTKESFINSLKELCVYAQQYDITLHLRVSPGKPPRNISEAIDFVENVQSPNLRIAPCTAMLLENEEEPLQELSKAKDRIGLWLAGAPGYDVGGILYSVHEPIAEAISDSISSLHSVLKIEPDVPVVLDAVYRNRDEEYGDLKIIESIGLE